MLYTYFVKGYDQFFDYLQLKIIMLTVYSPGVAEGTDTLHVLMTSMTDNAISRKGRPTSLSPFSFPTE